jgi:putative radical SAM enzyme (TIGR03279 family)
MPHTIERIDKKGLAYRHGLRIGDKIITVNNEELIDQIDYQYLTSQTRISIQAQKTDGRMITADIININHKALGLTLDESLSSRPRQCRNKCTFCFIDQMPGGMRDSLYIKDDDWRLSLMMGNYITLTNVDDAEFDRILRRKAGPLYISVHATNPSVRQGIMRNPSAGNLLARLLRLKDAGIRFHSQIVLCPGINDGKVLDDTLSDLAALYPSAQSAALVPVGLTRHRSGLASLEPFTRDSAATLLNQCAAWQRQCLERLGTRFVFPADELICTAGREIPDDKEYEDYPQIENGVGLLRAFEESLCHAVKSMTDVRPVSRQVTIACGTSVAPIMRRWMETYAPPGVSVSVLPIVNHYFGPTVTVSGLITGKDLMLQLSGVMTDEILICGNMLSHEDLFLDNIPLSTVREALTVPIHVIANDGESMCCALYAGI